MRLQVLGLMLASSLLMAADAPKDAVKKEYDKFEGTWKMESFTMDGKPSPIEDFADFRMTLKGENFTTVAADGKKRRHVQNRPEQVTQDYRHHIHERPARRVDNARRL